ncbi:MAG: hypothetical protein J6Y02_10205 [Pseudobutyrivibrio sp.]|nr:hypothetical protein [Pseudobutyrivibrio sp.]
MNYVKATMLSEDIIAYIRSAFTLFRVSDFVIIRGGTTAYGFNEELSIMKETELPQLNLPPIVIVSISTIMIKTEPFYLYNDSVILTASEPVMESLYFANGKLTRANMVADDLIRDIMTMTLSSSVQNLQQDASFAMHILTMTAADGVKYYNYNQHTLSLFTGILPVTKADTLQMDFFEKPEAPYFLTRFTIKKKAGVYVKVYLRYLKV